jgi:hypothetical protein
MKKEDNSFGVAAVILGIFSIMFASLNGIILGIIALIFANKQQKLFPNHWGKYGKVLSIIGIILSLIVMVILITKPEILALGGYGAS